MNRERWPDGRFNCEDFLLYLFIRLALFILEPIQVSSKISLSLLIVS